MRQIVQEGEKLYRQEVIRGDQITLRGLLTEEARLKTKKADEIKRIGDSYDERIALVKGDIAAVEQIMKKNAPKPAPIAKPGKTADKPKRTRKKTKT